MLELQSARAAHGEALSPLRGDHVIAAALILLLVLSWAFQVHLLLGLVVLAWMLALGRAAWDSGAGVPRPRWGRSRSHAGLSCENPAYRDAAY